MAGTASNHRAWVSPITAVCFLALGITGLMMMFHLRLPGVHGLHEGMGILFCLVGVVHLVLNWRTLLLYLRTRKGLIAMAAIIVLGSIMVMGGEDERHGGPRGGHGGPPPRAEAPGL